MFELRRVNLALFAALCLWSATWITSARAQGCHAPLLMAPHGFGLRAALEASAASFDTARYRGEYQGVAATASFARGPLLIHGRLPWFRITRNGLTDHGLGDAAAVARVRLLVDELQELQLGLAAATSAPTGDERHDLGMGHWMITPGAYGAFEHGAYRGEVVLAYSRAVAPQDDHHHHGQSGHTPLVSPMNPSEVQGSLVLARRLHPWLSLLAGAVAAVPVAERDGAARAYVQGGARLDPGWFDAGIDVAVPVVGDPFTLRLTLTLGASF